jgi:hypothetical protein
MSDENMEPERVWDEYDWERFLKQQDQKALRYLELMERYSDHPQRDMIVAQEMGWAEFGTEDVVVWMAEEAAGLMEEGEEEGDGFEGHPLYARVVELTLWLDEVCERKGEEFAENPAAVRLSDQLCEMASKLASALSDGESGDLGMTIAYLKRALRAAQECLQETQILQREGCLGRVRARRLRDALMEVRGEIVERMGRCRQEWKRQREGL